MDKRQFVATLLNWLEENGISTHGLHVSHGGSLLMMGLNDSTDDIDLTVTQEIFDHFDGKYPTKDIGEGRYLIVVTDLIDIHLMEKRDYPIVVTCDPSGIWYRDAQTTLDDYKVLNRPKDQEKFGVLERYIRKYPRSKIIN